MIGFSSNQLEEYRKREDRLNEEKFSLSPDSNLASIWLSLLDKKRSSPILYSILTRSWSGPLDKKKTVSSQHGEPLLPNNQSEAVVCVHRKLFVLHIRCLQGGMPGGGYSIFSPT